jgi:hypothetical protein
LACARRDSKAAPRIFHADGRKITVPHPDFVWMPAPGVLHVWLEEEKASERVNPLLVISVESRQQMA